MKVVRLTMFIIVLLYASFSGCYSQESEDDISSNDEFNEGIFAKLNPHSFFYDKGSKKMVPLDSVQLGTDVATLKSIPLLQDNTQEYIFYRRLIKLLLTKASVKHNHPNISGMIMIEGSASDFELLQEFLDGKTSIREADRILSNMIMDSKSENIYFTSHKMFYNAYDSIAYLADILTENIKITVVTVCCAILYIQMRKIRWSPALIIFFLIAVIFVVSFFIVWYQLVQEAQIKLRVAQDQFMDAPISCRPDEMNIWQKFLGFIRTDNSCEKYYKGVMSNPFLEVTPAFVLSHLLTTVILHPVSYSGKVISSFIDSATEKLSFYERLPVVILLFVSVALLIVILPVCLATGYISLGFGPFGSITLRKPETNSQKALKGKENLKRTEDVYEAITDDRARRTITNDQKKKKYLKSADEKNKHAESEICTDEDCCMASGDKIRENKYSDSEEEVNKPCAQCENVGLEGGDH